MTNVTKKFSNRVAVAFDFDETLAPGSFETLLDSRGIDPMEWKAKRVQPLVETGWDEQLAKFYRLVEESKRDKDRPITIQSLHELGRGLQLFEGVPELFEAVVTSARTIIPDVEVEFYLITSGLVEIARATSIGRKFKKLWGCEFHYSDDGEIECLKQIVTHTEKTRYLLQISNGRTEQTGNTEHVNLFHVADDGDQYIPLSQMVYVGDGSSDIPVFSLMQAHHGIAIGVYKPDHSVHTWESNSQMSNGRRIANLAPADFSEGGELLKSLILAVESICKRIALMRLSDGE